MVLELIIGGLIALFLLSNRNKENIERKQVTFFLPQETKPEPPTRLTREQLLSGSFNFDDFRTFAR